VSKFSSSHPHDALGLFRHHIAKFASRRRVVNADDCRCRPVQDTRILAAGWWADSVLLAGVVARPRLPAVLVPEQLRLAPNVNE
jgi:hypothetical protein